MSRSTVLKKYVPVEKTISTTNDPSYFISNFSFFLLMVIGGRTERTKSPL